MKYTAQNMANQCGNTAFLDGQMDSILLAEINQMADVYSGRIFVVNESYGIVLDTASLYEDRTCVSDEVFRCMTGNSSIVEASDRHYMSFALPITISDQDGNGKQQIVGVLVFGASTQSIASIVDVMNEKANVLLLLGFLLLSVFAYGMSGVFATPFRRAIVQMDALETGNLNMELDSQGFDVNRKAADAVNTISALDGGNLAAVPGVDLTGKKAAGGTVALGIIPDGVHNVPVSLYVSGLPAGAVPYILFYNNMTHQWTLIPAMIDPVTGLVVFDLPEDGTAIVVF